MIDFEDACWAFPVQDIANCLAQWIDEPNYAELETAFLDAYGPSAAERNEMLAFMPFAHLHRQFGLLSYAMRSQSFSADELSQWMPEMLERLLLLESKARG